MATTMRNGVGLSIKSREAAYGYKYLKTTTGEKILVPAIFGFRHRLLMASTFVDAAGRSTYGTYLPAAKKVKINTVPTDGSIVTIDTVASAAKNFNINTAGADADPNYFVIKGTTDTVIDVAKRLWDKILGVLAADVDLFWTGVPGEFAVFDKSGVGATTIAAKSGGDSAGSITITNMNPGTAASTGQMPVEGGAGKLTVVHPFSESGWFETAENEALALLIGDADNEHTISYISYPVSGGVA